MFRIERPSTDGIVRLTIEGGLFNEAVLADIRRQLFIVADACRIARRPFDMLVDLTRSSAQPSEVAGMIGGIMAGLVERGMRRSAHILTSTILKLQLERIAPTGEIAFFDNEAEARAWLAGPVDPQPDRMSPTATSRSNR